MSLADLLLQAPANAAVHTIDTTWSRADVESHASTIEAALRAARIGGGEPVGVRLPNGPLLIAALFGIWRAGAAYVPLNPRSPLEETGAHLGAVQPVAVLSAIDDLQTITGGAPGELVASSEGWTLRRVERDEGERREPDPRVALIQFTSGTTGRPKPVPLEHDTVLDLLDRVVGSLRTSTAVDGPPRPPMPNLVPVSLSLWSGIYQVLFAFRVGAAVVLMDKFDTRVFVELIQRFEIRSTVLPPAAMIMLSDDDEVRSLAPLKYVRSIAAPLHPAQARRFRDRFGIVVLNAYGQTELGGEVVGWSASDARAFGETKLGSVGRPHDGISVRQGDGTEDDAAELQIRTPATAAGRVPPELAERVTADGWLRTGDIGRVDDDGFVWIDGRVSDMINRGGLKVFPGQVEEALLSCPAVRDAAVVGAPDQRLGEVPWAFVVLDDDAPGAPDLAAWCRARLSPYKVPARFVPVPKLPRNEAGKVLRAELLRVADAR